MGVIRGIFHLLAGIPDFLMLRLFYNSDTVVKYFRRKGARIGENCCFQVRYLGEAPYLLDIGNHVYLSDNVLLHTTGSNWMVEQENPETKIFGKIVIEDNCFVGRNAQILPNVRIGRNSIVGAGSVVISDVPPDSVVLGVPARVIGSSNKYKEKIVAEWNRQKPPGWPFKDPEEKKRMLQKYIRDSKTQT
jgi:acetyltransferase-like isoleucine patch superfamily enzyme